MQVKDLRPLVEPDLTRKGLKWNNVAYVEFFPQYYEVTCWIRGFDGNIMFNPLEDDAYKTTVRFEYKEIDNGVVEDQGVQEQSSEEASRRCSPYCTFCTPRASHNGNPSGSTREGPGDGPKAEASAEAPSEEAEAPSRRYTGFPITACGPGGQLCGVIGACYNHR